MKTTFDFCICLLSSLLVLGLRVTKSDGAKIMGHCKEDKDCESTHCCKDGSVGYCKDTCDAPIYKAKRTGALEGKELCSPAKKRFRFYNEIVNWYTALRTCCLQGSGARLADIETPEDDIYFRDIAPKYCNGATTGIWIGANAISSAQRNAINLTWAWTNEPVINLNDQKFDNWYAGEHCIHLRDSKGDTIYNDLSCFGQNFYLCYYPNEKCIPDPKI